MAAVTSRRALTRLSAAARPRGGAPFATRRDAPLRWVSSSAKDSPARDPRLFCVVGSGPAGMYADACECWQATILTVIEW